MTFRYFVKVEMVCHGCGATLTHIKEGDGAYYGNPWNWLRDKAVRNRWIKIGRAPDKTHTYYCGTCCANKPEVIAMIARRRLAGKEV